MKINLNFIEACSLLEKNETTSVELIKTYLNNIKEATELNCFNTISEEQALDHSNLHHYLFVSQALDHLQHSTPFQFLE